MNIGVCGLAFLIWSIVSISCLGLSGSVYYEISNHWVYGVPWAVFGLAWAISLNIRPPNVSKVAHKNGGGHRSQEVSVIDYLARSMLPVVVAMNLMAIYVAYSISSALGISFASAQELRSAFYENMESLGGAYFSWAAWIFTALGNYLFIIGVARDASRGRPASIFSLLSFLLLVIWSLTTGGRMAIFSAVIIYLATWFGSQEIKITRSRGGWLAAAFFLAPFFYQVLNRIGGEDFSIGEFVVVKYFVGPVFAMDQQITLGVVDDIRNAAGRLGVSLLGLDTLFISGFARGVLGLDIESLLSTTSSLFHYGVRIADSVSMNAHYTSGNKWYIDFGLPGYFVFYVLMAGAFVLYDRNMRMAVDLRYLFSGVVVLSVVYSSREFLLDSPSMVVTVTLLLATAIAQSRASKKSVIAK